MTTLHWTSRSSACGPRAPGRALALTALLALPVLLGGCGVPVVGSLGNLIGGRDVPREQALREEIVEMQTQTTYDPGEAYWPYRLGELYVMTDSIPGAEAALKTALARNAFYTPALSLLSKLYYEAGRHEEAVVMLEGVRARPEAFGGSVPASLLDGLALHYDALDRTDLAQGVMASQPQAGDATSAHVFLRLRSDTPDAANTMAKVALERNPKSAVNYNNYGIAKLREGDPAAARRAFKSAMKLDEDLPGPYYNMAILERFYFFNDDEAEKWFKQYRERARQDPDGLAEVFSKAEPKPLAERTD